MPRPTPKEVADTISNFLNVMSNQEEVKEVIELLLRDHRTLQQSTMRFMLSYIEETARRYNANNRGDFFDLRNEDMGKLAAEFPDVHIHTHLAENKAECEFVAEQFPWSRSYLDVYQHFGLVRERSVFAHCLHLDSEDRQTMAEQKAAMAFCPTSNLFLGSGLFDLRAASDAGVRVGVGTDVGGGTSFNMFRTLSEGYKVLHLQDQSLPPYKAFYLATLGGARSLYLDDKIGNLQAGKEADFVVIDSAASPTTSRRLSLANDIAEKLFALVMLGDDRAIAATYVMGKLAYAN